MRDATPKRQTTDTSIPTKVTADPLDIRGLVQPVRLRYTPYLPTAKQYAFLCLHQKEVFYGGAAGGGKSIALLMAALQYADVPGYAALILRKSYADLILPGALMDVATDWLGGTDARWDGSAHTWSFPGGGRLVFGYLDTAQHKYRYQSAAFQYIGFDELTQFREADYTYLFSRCRRPNNPSRGVAADGTGINKVPLRVRSASNPGGAGHEWVNGRFVDPETRHPRTVFLPAKLSENEHLDFEAYVEMFEGMGSVDRLRLLEGDWEATDEGTVFRREWFQTSQDTHANRVVRYWDTAATEPHESNKDPDYTVGTLMGRRGDGRFVVLDVARFRGSPGATDQFILQTAALDGRKTEVWIQEEPGSSSKLLTHHYAKLLEGYIVKAHKVDKNKETRAKPWAAALENGLVDHIPGQWIHEYVREHAGFPNRIHDDQVDSASGAHFVLTSHKVSGRRRTRTARGAEYQIARSSSVVA